MSGRWAAHLHLGRSGTGGSGGGGRQIADIVRINEKIRADQVRLIGPNGEQVGIVALGEALQYADRLNLDLVEVAPMANPPVLH